MYSPPLSDTEAQRMITVQASAAQALGVYLDGPHVWGWAGRTLGQRALHPQRGACWLRVLSAPVDKANGKLREGTSQAAEVIPDSVRRPQLLAVRDHTADGLAFRAELTEFIPAPVLSPDPVLRHEPSITTSFLEQLRRDLQTVAQTRTDRVAVRQEWIDRRVPELTGVPAPPHPRLGVRARRPAPGQPHDQRAHPGLGRLRPRPPGTTTPRCSTPTACSPRTLQPEFSMCSPRS